MLGVVRDPTVMRVALPNRTVLFSLALLVTSGALAEQLAIVSLGKRAVLAAHIEQGIARCQRDAPELGIRDCVERFQVPLWRLNQAADARFDADAPLRREIESRALAERLTEVLVERAAVEEPAIAAYLQENQAAWQTPERLRLFRILLADREQAQALLAELGRPTPADFRAAARTHSLDHTSHQRGGDLGFVAADGTTDLPGVKADPALFLAARRVEDGALLPQPVAEGTQFAVVWRRGSLPERRLPAAEAHSWASQRLREAGARREIERLVAAQPSERKPDLLARFRRSECRLFTR